MKPTVGFIKVWRKTDMNLMDFDFVVDRAAGLAIPIFIGLSVLAFLAVFL